jgi:ketopantoate reductase
MNALTAINTLASLLQVAMNGLAAASQISAIIQKAHAEGRDISAVEMSAIKQLDDSARQTLVDAINAATP